MQVNIDSIEDLIANLRIEEKGLGEIINPIIEKYNLAKKEILEVCQIGKFVLKIDSKIRIREKPSPPRPDFLIEHESKVIGLEHTRIFTENARNYNHVKTVIEYSEDLYRNTFPEDRVMVNITIIGDKLEYKQNQKKQIATELAKYINCIKNGIQAKKPSYIENVTTTNHSKTGFVYKETKWQSEYLTRERLGEEIKKKKENLKYTRETKKKFLSIG